MSFFLEAEPVPHGWLYVLSGVGTICLLLMISLLLRRRGVRPPQRGARFTSSDADYDSPSGDQVLSEETRRVLDAQHSGSDQLDQRIATAFGVGSTILPVSVALLNLLIDANEELPRCLQRTLLMSLIAYGALIAFSAASFFAPKVVFRPDVSLLDIHRSSGKLDGAQLRLWVAEERLIAIRENRERLRWKGWFALLALIALFVEAFLLSLAAYQTVT